MAAITAVASGDWTTGSGALFSGGVMPTAADDVTIPSGISLKATSGAAVAVCRSLTVDSGATLQGAGQVHIGDASGGALTISSGATITISGGIQFVSTSTNGGLGWPITTNGKTLPNVTFNGVGGKWTLQDALTCSGNFTVSGGYFNANAQNMTLAAFNGVVTTSTRTVDITNCSITLTSGGGTPWNMGYGLPVTGMTFIYAGSTLTFTGSLSYEFRGGGLTYNNVVFNMTTGSTPIQITAANTFNNLTFNGAAGTACNVVFTLNNIVTGTLTVTGNSATNRILFYSDVLGTPRVITAAAVSLTDVDFMDIAIVGPTGSTITSDSFDRSNGSLGTSDAATGGSALAWSSDGTWSISSNKASRSGGGGNSFAVVETGTSDQWVQTTYQSGTIGLVARYTDSSNCIYVNYSGSASGLTVLRGGSIVYIAGLPAPHNTAVAGDVITLAVNGNVVRVMKNGNIVYWSVPQYTTVLTQAESTLSGTKAGLSTNATAGSSDDFTVQAIPNVTGTRLGDCLGNSGITFTTASGTARDGGGVGVKRYAVAVGNFSSTATWSETSGGSPGASVPLPQDDVYLDASSAAGTYTVNMPRVCRNLDLTGFTRTFILPSSTTAYNFYGNVITPASGYTYTGQNTVLIHLRGRGSHTLAIDSWTGNFNYGIGVYIGTYTLTQNTTSALALNANGPRFDIYSNGTLNTGGYNFGASAVVPQTAGRFVANSSTVNLGWTIDCSGGGSVDGANATFVYITTPVFPGTSNRGLTGNALSAFGTVTWTEANAPGSLTLAGANTIGTLNIGSGRSLRLTSGTTQKIGTLNLNGVPRGGVRLPGVGGTYLSTPDSAAVSVTGDIDIRVRVALTDWTPGASQALIGKYVSTANQGSYILAIDTGGRPNFLVSDSGGGGSWVYVGGAAWVDGTTYWVRVTHTMAGLLRFFYAADSSTMPTSWTQLGSDQTAFTYGKYDSTAPLEIGSYGNGVSMNAVGTFYRAQIRNNVLDDGTGIVFDTDFSNQFGPHYVDSSTNGAIVTPSTTLANVGDGRVVIESATAGSAATLQVDTVTGMNYVDLKGVVMNGADTYIGATSVIRSNVKGVRRGPKTGLGV